MAATLVDLAGGLTNEDLFALSAPLRQTLDATPYSTPEGDPISVKSLFQSLLLPHSPRPVLDLLLCCAAIASSVGEDSPRIFWVTSELRDAAGEAMRALAGRLGLGGVELVETAMGEVMPVLKGVIRESLVDPEAEDVGEGTAKPPLVYAVVAGLQFRWLVTQVHYPNLGQLCSLVIPCALTALDHWSPEVKDQGMLSFIHIANNVTAAELAWYEDPILDACCNNIVASDELWHRVMEMSVILLTSILKGNPRSTWYEKLFTEMLSHLERQPMNKERRLSWLLCIDPVFNAMGLVLLAHFKRIFLLFFRWLHADDDKTILLVLERIQTIIKLTWIRKSPHFDRLIDELILVYKEASMRKSRDAIRTDIANIFILLKECKGMQFDVAWNKHKMDPNLTQLTLSIYGS